MSVCVCCVRVYVSKQARKLVYICLYLYFCVCIFQNTVVLGGRRDEQVVYRSCSRRSTGRPKKPKCARSSPREVDTFTWFHLFSLKSTTEKRIGGAITTAQLWVK